MKKLLFLFLNIFIISNIYSISRYYEVGTNLSFQKRKLFNGLPYRSETHLNYYFEGYNETSVVDYGVGFSQEHIPISIYEKDDGKLNLTTLYLSVRKNIDLKDNPLGLFVKAQFGYLLNRALNDSYRIPTGSLDNGFYYGFMGGVSFDLDGTYLDFSFIYKRLLADASINFKESDLNHTIVGFGIALRF